MNLILLIISVKLTIELAIQTVLSTGINVSDILHHYALLCGSSGEDLSQEYSFLPFTSEAINVCPLCYDDIVYCRVKGNCCPGIELQYPAPDCVDSILYPVHKSTDDNDNFSKKYWMIQTCPDDFDTSLLKDAEKCTGYSENLFDLTENVPVTDIDSLLTFRNKHCAKCHGVQKFIPWQIDVKCDRSLKLSLILEDIVTFTLENNCTVRVIPDRVVNAVSKVCDDKKLINECNVTGTWTEYNKNIDYACRTLTSTFHPYRNVFCYICNPPKRLPSDTTINTCIKDNFYNYSMVEVENACKHAGKSEATHPYQNIYCYMCNSKFSVDTHVRPYSTQVHDSGIISYRLIDTNVYPDDEIYNGHLIRSLNKCSVNFAKVQKKMECVKMMPISLFSPNATEDIMKYHEDFGCNMTDISYREYRSCEKNQNGGCLNQTIMDVYSACQTFGRINYFIGNGDRDEQLSIDTPCSKPSYILLSPHDESNICWNVLHRGEKYIFPIETAFCDCNLDPRYNEPYFQIPRFFNFDYYCGNFQVYDSVVNRCRALECFVGKQFRYSRCDTILPLNRLKVDLQYHLPLLFTSNIVSKNVTELLRHYASVNHSIEIEVCLMQAKENDILLLEQIAFISVKNVYYLVDIEVKLIKLVSGLLAKPFENVHVDYYYWNYHQSANKSCGGRNQDIFTVTDLLTCRHVLFLRHEYTVAEKHQIYIPMYETKLNFYEYEIDKDGNLRICIERFKKLAEVLRNKLSVHTIAMFVCTCVSVLCLLFTFVTYCVFPSLRTLPGKNIMNMVLSLFLYHTFYMVLMIIKEIDDVVCRFVGIMTHFFILCCFGSFTICTVHMFRLFGQTKMSSSAMGIYDKRSFFIYMFCVYGSSVAIVAIHIMVSYVISGMASVGYGWNGKCFVSTLNGFIVTIVVPLVITFIVNITLYTITAHRLKKKVQGTSELTNNRKQNKKDMLILAKLFLTTGCSWILLLINFVVDNVYIYVAISGLNTLQGVFIFIAYICNKRVLNLYKTKLSRHPEMASTHSTSKNTKTTYMLKHSVDEQDNNKDQTTRSDLKPDQEMSEREFTHL